MLFLFELLLFCSSQVQIPIKQQFQGHTLYHENWLNLNCIKIVVFCIYVWMRLIYFAKNKKIKMNAIYVATHWSGKSFNLLYIDAVYIRIRYLSVICSFSSFLYTFIYFDYAHSFFSLSDWDRPSTERFFATILRLSSI